MNKDLIITGLLIIIDLAIFSNWHNFKNPPEEFKYSSSELRALTKPTMFWFMLGIGVLIIIVLRILALFEAAGL